MENTIEKSITLLAIESSCDDTSASIIKNGKICSNIIASQEIHSDWGGVVPELASRAHQENIVYVVDAALKKAKVSKEDLCAIAYTGGPGLMGSLMVGSSFAKSMALAIGIPSIAVHHMKAHIFSHFIDEPTPTFPFLCLTVSGGHTQIVQVNSFNQFILLGETLDDAAGEAFDKCAKMIGLPYPGGPEIDKLAKTGNSKSFTFTQPNVDPLMFSFSGFKTAVKYFLDKEVSKNSAFIEENRSNLAASIQYTIVDILMNKLKEAIKQTNIKSIAIAGGVSANSELRNRLKSLEQTGCQVFIPKLEYCLDNAAMIAITGHLHYLNKEFTPLDFEPKARWNMFADS